jgi:hypothetical protein
MIDMNQDNTQPKDQEPIPVEGEIKDLVNKLHELKKYHIMPYNLGDMGQMCIIIERLHKLCNRPSPPPQSIDIETAAKEWIENLLKFIQERKSEMQSGYVNAANEEVETIYAAENAGYGIVEMYIKNNPFIAGHNYKP